MPPVLEVNMGSIAATQTKNTTESEAEKENSLEKSTKIEDNETDSKQEHPPTLF